MKVISHRINSLEALSATNVKYGVEVDIRSSGNELIVHHDPMALGCSFESWIAEYQHGTLILNVKEEGLERAVLDLMASYKIDDFFFLDQSFPFLVKWSNQGLRRAAVRVSEFEPIETAMMFAGQIDWVWVDCFTHLALTGKEAECLQSAGFSLCLVSPELQGRDPDTEIPAMQQVLLDRGIIAEAVCTKRPDLWI